MQKKLKVNIVSESEFGIKGHGVHTAYVEQAKALKKRTDVNVSVNSEEDNFDVTHIHTVGTFALKRLTADKGKKVISAHIVTDSLMGSLAMAKYWRIFAEFYLKFFYKRADLVLAVSQMVKDELVNNMGLKNRVEVLYNTIDMSQYKTGPADKVNARKKLNIGPNEFVVLGNGQIQPRKRFDLFVDLARKMPQRKFIWVGGIPFKLMGAEYNKMNKLIQTAPSNLFVTGVIELSEVKSYLQAADVFVLPAEQENHPMCVLEAAGAGLPIILRDIPEYTDTFKGFVLLADDATFGASIETLATDHNALSDLKAKSARLAERFDSSEGARRLVEFYKSLF